MRRIESNLGRIGFAATAATFLMAPGTSRADEGGVGPQIGYIFPVGDMQGFLGLRGYGDINAVNRAPGWSTWLTFAISPAAPEAAPRRPLISK